MSRSYTRLIAVLLTASLAVALGTGCQANGPACKADAKCCEGTVKLFNGKDLTGWEPIGKADWKVEDGVLVGTQGPGKAPGDLLTSASFGDFELTVTYKVVWPANTGIWFRYQSEKQAYQADILEWPDPVAYSGTIYCPGKMFLTINNDKGLEKRDDWNCMKIRAEGDHLQVWLNGTLVADVHETVTMTGKIGFQVHAGDQFANMKVMIREAVLKPLNPTCGG